MIAFLFVSCTMVAEQLGAPKDPSNTTEQVFTVPKGTTARKLGPLLQEAGLIDSADNFKNYLRITKEGGCIKAGRFPLNPSMSASELIARMCENPLANDKPFTVVEGWRISEIDDALSEGGWIEPGEYKRAASDISSVTAPFPLPTSGTLEGYLYPETYMLSPDRFTVQTFIQRQVDTLADVFYSKHKTYFTSFSEKSLVSLIAFFGDRWTDRYPLIGLVYRPLISKVKNGKEKIA